MSHPNDETMWTDWECIRAYRGVLGPGVHDASVTVGRALLDERARADKAEALVAVLKAECRAWRSREACVAHGLGTAAYEAEFYLKKARAATDAALGGETL